MKVLTCDDQAIVRDGLAMLLRLEPDIQIAGKAANGAEAAEMVGKEKPDIVLADIKMPVMNGVEATREIKIKCPDVKVLVLTTHDANEWVFGAIRSGASGYLLEDTPCEELVKAIRRVLNKSSPP